LCKQERTLPSSPTKSLCALALIVLTNPAGAWEFVTEDFPPFTYPAASVGQPAASADTGGVAAAGPFVDIVQAVCARLHRDCPISVYPWRRALALAEEGKVDGIFTVIHSPRREHAFHITRMLTTSRYSVYAPRSSTFVYHQPQDMAGKTIGVYGPSGTSFALRERLQQVPGVSIRLVADNRRLLRMLEAGRFGSQGLAVLNQDVAWHLIETERLDQVREVGELQPVSYGIGLSRQRVSTAQFEAFEAQLEALIADGTVPAILRRYQLEAAF